jgi:hypothetical protein
MQGSTKGVAIDTDANFTLNSDQLVPSQKAVKTAFTAWIIDLASRVTGILPVANGGTGVTSYSSLAIEIGQIIYPVGKICEFNVSTNPAALLGFGTWAAFGTGRVTVAIDTGQTEFDVNGETGGEKTHLLTSGESGVPLHTHLGLSVAGGDLGINAGANTAFSLTNANATGNLRIDTKNNVAADAVSAHNNLQPYIVVYRWVRTA